MIYSLHSSNNALLFEYVAITMLYINNKESLHARRSLLIYVYNVPATAMEHISLNAFVWRSKPV